MVGNKTWVKSVADENGINLNQENGTLTGEELKKIRASNFTILYKNKLLCAKFLVSKYYNKIIEFTNIGGK